MKKCGQLAQVCNFLQFFKNWSELKKYFEKLKSTLTKKKNKEGLLVKMEGILITSFEGESSKKSPQRWSIIWFIINRKVCCCCYDSRVAIWPFKWSNQTNLALMKLSSKMAKPFQLFEGLLNLNYLHILR